MCGLVVAAGSAVPEASHRAGELLGSLAHRGPDDRGTWEDPRGRAMLGHRRLSILDPSPAGHQPMVSPDGRHVIVFNGEIYNYRELATELRLDRRTSGSDTEVLLEAFRAWGPRCLDRLIGMFAFAIWDEHDGALFAARDRFGVKPLFIATPQAGGLLLASEIKALHAGGVPRQPEPSAWATYLTSGHADFSDRTFWRDVRPLPAGHLLQWSAPSGPTIRRWYDVAGQIGPEDERHDAEVIDELHALLLDAVRLRFRSDVPVGVNLSGGLDSSVLLGAIDGGPAPQHDVHAFTFVTGDPAYDELPWVKMMLEGSRHPLHVCRLDAADVPALALDMQRFQDEPYGGLPTLAYGRLFEQARESGVVVLLDGQGMDEQWAGYDYYANPSESASVVQGTGSALRPQVLPPEFARLAAVPSRQLPSADELRNLQVRDLTTTKIPRALRYNDRAAMRRGVELREPFLDHRLVELALRQPAHRKIRDGVHKYLLRVLATQSLPSRLVDAPKRPLQTPQREWLRGPLRRWATDTAEHGFAWQPGWLDVAAARRELGDFFDGRGDNSFFVWQWISLGMIAQLEDDSGAFSR